MAPALGFTIVQAEVKDEQFSSAMTALFPHIRFSKPGSRKRGRSMEVDLIFSTSSSVPHPRQSYWSHSCTPHILSWDDGCAFDTPPGWSQLHHKIAHSTVGGSTDASHSLSLLLPPGALFRPMIDIALPSQPWVPVEAAIDSRIGAKAAAPLPRPVQRSAEVVWEGDHVSPYGLFPADSVGAVVRVPCVFLPDGWGSRALRPAELATLWDVPLLLQEWCRDNDMACLLTSLLSAVPGKTLLLGGDFLISHTFRGGESDGKLPDPPCLPLPSSAPPLISVIRAPQEECATDACLDLDEVDEAIVKADGQKSDDAEIPVHLWDGFVKRALLELKITLPFLWRRGLWLFRLGFIRFWRRAVLFSFWSYVKDNTRGIRQQYPTPGEQSRWVFPTPGKSRLRPTGLDGTVMVKYDFDWYYAWTSEGRARYKAFHSLLREHPPLKNDWEPARDCLT